jgi:hypothetical protein
VRLRSSLFFDADFYFLVVLLPDWRGFVACPAQSDLFLFVKSMMHCYGFQLATHLMVVATSCGFADNSHI